MNDTEEENLSPVLSRRGWSSICWNNAISQRWRLRSLRWGPKHHVAQRGALLLASVSPGFHPSARELKRAFNFLLCSGLSLFSRALNPLPKHSQSSARTMWELSWAVFQGLHEPGCGGVGVGIIYICKNKSILAFLDWDQMWCDLDDDILTVTKWTNFAADLLSPAMGFLSKSPFKITLLPGIFNLLCFSDSDCWTLWKREGFDLHPGVYREFRNLHRRLSKLEREISFDPFLPA